MLKFFTIKENMETDLGSLDEIFGALLRDKIIFINEEITVDVATAVNAALIYFDNIPVKKGKDIVTIYLNSPGGEVNAALFPILTSMDLLKAKYKIKTVCTGECYSAAAVLLSNGTKGMRFAYPLSKVLIHDVQIENMSGSFGDIQKQLKEVKGLNDSLMDILANNSGQSIKQIKKDCHRETIFSANEAISYGLVDKIVQPEKSEKCKHKTQ